MTSRVDPQDATTHAEIVAAFNVLRDGLGVTDHLSEEEAFALTRLALWAANGVRRSAVVRPTRAEIAEVIAWPWPSRDRMLVPVFPTEEDYASADAVLALFGVAVSDSQETPTP